MRMVTAQGICCDGGFCGSSFRVFGWGGGLGLSWVFAPISVD